MKKKRIIAGLSAILCLGLLAGFNASAKEQKNNRLADGRTIAADSGSLSGPDAYRKLIAFKAAHYDKMSVADFNQSLTPDNEDISELLDAQAEISSSILPEDENYSFITVTLAASLEELYCEQTGEETGFSDYLERKERPQETQSCQFIFYALYRLHYTISDPDKLTVAKRDDILQKFRTEYQSYVNDLSEEKLASSEVKTLLEEKGDELAQKLSINELELSCEVEHIEVHNEGGEIVG